MLEKITKTLSILFAVFWVVILFSEYWQFNPNYANAIQFFQYWDLLIILFLLGGGLSRINKNLKKKTFKFVNGLSLFVGVILLDLLAISLFYGKVESLKMDTLGLFSHLGHLVGVVICVFSVYLTGRVLGAYITNRFQPKIRKSDLPIIQASLGIMTLTFVLFFVAVFGLLNVLTIAPLMLIILIIDYRTTLEIIQNTLWKPIPISKKLNAIGIFSFLFLATFLVFDFVQILRPFPLGTDSINLYVNLPSLIADYNSLTEGNQPYNWSLFMSLGTVLFGRIDVTLGLSFLGGVLALFALFQLSRKWLDINYAALCLLLFFSVPMVNFLSYMDMKIDMSLLFILLSVLLVFYNWVMPIQNAKSHSKRPTKIPFFSFNQEITLIILMGLLTGFAFGIKLTAVFLTGIIAWNLVCKRR